MERSHLLRALAGQRNYCDGRSPLYAEILGGLNSDPDAAWLGDAEQAWRERRFAVDWEAAHLLLAGMHYAALKGEAAELAAVYPSCGGAHGDAGRAGRQFLARAAPEFWQHLATARVQTNEVGRSVAWMLAAAAAFGAREIPFHLVELGTSAGLNLVGDWLEPRVRFTGEGGIPPAGWKRRPHRVLTRTGLDLRPRDLADAGDRLWLKACVWADDVERLARLDRAMKTFFECKPAPRLARCTFADAPAWLEQIPPRTRDGLLVFNSIATVYLDDAAYADLERGMARVLERWGDRAIWVEYERPRAAPGEALELRIHTTRGTRVVASGAPRPALMRLHEATPWQLF